MTIPPWWALVAGPFCAGFFAHMGLSLLSEWLDSRNPRRKHRTDPSRRLPMAHSPKR